MTEADVRDMLRERSSKTSMREWCRQNNVNRHHASEFMNGHRSPTTDLLNALGLEYRIVRKKREQPR